MCDREIQSTVSVDAWNHGSSEREADDKNRDKNNVKCNRTMPAASKQSSGQTEAVVVGRYADNYIIYHNTKN